MTPPAHTDDSSNTPNSLQFELFSPFGESVPSTDVMELSEVYARASVSPGWWPLLVPLFDNDAADVTIHACAEVDGQLVLHASSPHDPAGLQVLVQRIVDAASHVCGCCGESPAERHRRRDDEAARVVCPRCRTRLDLGDPYLEIADECWRLDGTRREARVLDSDHWNAARSGVVPRNLRSCTILPPDELRRLIGDIRSSMMQRIIGADQAVRELALLCALHVGAGMPLGARALIIGPSGSGKSASIAAMREALAEWDLAWVTTDAIDLTSPGWSGAPTIGGLIGAAIGNAPRDSSRARRPIVVIDEIHHIGVGHGLDGNMKAKKDEVLSSFLGVVGRGVVHLNDGAESWSSQEALVIGMGAFTGTLDSRKVVATDDVVRAGLPVELATRFEQVIRVAPLAEPELRRLLRQWPALKELEETCTRLGYTVRILEESFRRAARVVTLGFDGSTARSAGGWLVSALRESLIAALADARVHELVIAPDSLPIPPGATTPRAAEPPDEPGGWDSVSRLTPR